MLLYVQEELTSTTSQKHWFFFCSKKLIWSLLHACADADLCRGTSLVTTSSQLNPNKVLKQWIDPQLLSISLKQPTTQLWTHTQLMCMFLTHKIIQKAAGAGLAEIFPLRNCWSKPNTWNHLTIVLGLCTIMTSQICYEPPFLYLKCLKLIYLDHTSKIFTTNIVLSLQIQVPQLTGTNWIVLGIEFVKSMECLTSLEEEKPK